MRVLVLDDAQDNLRLVELILKSENYDLHCFSNPDDALGALTQNNDFKVALIDLEMPETSGIDFIQKVNELHSQGGLVKPTMIAFTAHDRGAKRDMAFQAGFVDLVKKPFTPEEIKSAIRQHINESPPSKPKSDLTPLIPGFLKNRLKDVARIEEALGAKDWNAICQVAHKVKGTAGSYGFEKISEICGLIEISSENNPEFEKISSQIETFRALVLEACDEYEVPHH